MPAESRPPPHVLIIHNHNDVDKYVQYLEHAGLHVRTSRVDGEHIPDEFLASVIADQPDIVVLDFDCDGEIVKALKKEFLTRNIPIVALAALADLDAAQAVTSPGPVE